MARFGFLQADPIRAPVRAQDLILRLRVKDYRAGDLERRYERLGLEEDFFVNYGFVTKELQALMHPRPGIEEKHAREVLAFVKERGAAHPREVDAHFLHGKVRNYWGGQSSATTHLLAAMHYGGMLRVARREGGIRIYAAHEHGAEPTDAKERQARIDALVDIAAGIYAPMPRAGLLDLVRRLRHGAPQWQSELKAAGERAMKRLMHARVEGVDWYWPADEKVKRAAVPEGVRLLAPFDPVVWDRERLEMLWGWVYRFEAYTPAAKRKMGYYAMPLLWEDQVIGWGNLAVEHGELKAEFGYAAGHAPRDGTFRGGLEAEVDRVRVFLGLT